MPASLRRVAAHCKRTIPEEQRRGVASLAALALLLSVGCGGDGSSSSVAGGGIGGSGISQGEVTGLGSIVVNGVTWNTDTAAVSFDGVAGPESDLATGMIVTVTGTLDAGGTTGTATNVDVDDAIEGPIVSIANPTMGGSMTVFRELEFDVWDQTVRVERVRTFFDEPGVPSSNFGFDSLLNGVGVGSLVEVSGFRDSSGVIIATRVRRMGNAQAGVGQLVSLRGPVSSLGPGQFSVGIVTVVITPGDGIPGLVNGDEVEVRGELATTLTEIASTSLALADTDGFEDTASLALEGLATDVEAMAQTFRIDGQLIDASLLPLPEDGERVIVEGAVSMGLLTPTALRRDLSDHRVEGRVSAVDAAAGTVTVAEIPVVTDVNTAFDDDLIDQNDDFGLSDVVVNNFLRVRGERLSTPGQPDQLLASRILRDDEDNDDRVLIRGRPDAGSITISGSFSSYQVLGVSIDFDGGTLYSDVDDSTLTRNEFEMAIGEADILEARDDDSNLLTFGLARRLSIEEQNVETGSAQRAAQPGGAVVRPLASGASEDIAEADGSPSPGGENAAGLLDTVVEALAHGLTPAEE